MGLRTGVPAYHCLALPTHPLCPTIPLEQKQRQKEITASRAIKASTGPKVGMGTIPAGTEFVHARKRRGQSSSHQKASCAGIARGRGTGKGAKCRTKGAPSWQCHVPCREGRSPQPGSPNSDCTNNATQAPPTHSQSLPCFGARDLGTHIPQVEVTHWPVVRLLPMPTGAGWVQCPIVQLPAWGLPT